MSTHVSRIGSVIERLGEPSEAHIGMRNIDAAAVEAAGTWFPALVSLGAVVIAARVFLSDKLFQDYQLAADQEREREEQAERNG
jgi:hypothetical protein